MQGIRLSSLIAALSLGVLAIACGPDAVTTASRNRPAKDDGPRDAASGDAGSGGPTPQGVTTLVLGSFKMIEFQYESLPGHYFYAPQIRVATDGGTVTIKALDFRFPDGSRAPPFCSTGIKVTGADRDLVGEIYGEYEFSLDYGDGHRAEPGGFAVTVTYVDAEGRVGTLAAMGEVVPGGLPTTYTGGFSSMNPGSCSSAGSPAGPTSSNLLLESFRMIEFQYDSWGHYFYAPQIRVASALGLLTVKKLEFSFPGATLGLPFCSNGIPVTSAGRNLVGEIYGDYEMSIDYADGHRADAGHFTVRVTYVDAEGRVGTLSATGDAVPGALPTTYTGGPSSMNPGGC
jgi:hypothetical protein